MRARCDSCPVCGDLTFWRVGDRVLVLLDDSGTVRGVDCDSCGGWSDDDQAAQLELMADIVEEVRSTP